VSKPGDEVGAGALKIEDVGDARPLPARRRQRHARQRRREQDHHHDRAGDAEPERDERRRWERHRSVWLAARCRPGSHHHPGHDHRPERDRSGNQVADDESDPAPYPAAGVATG
jgi:hypothetical protein